MLVTATMRTATSCADEAAGLRGGDGCSTCVAIPVD
jgi:hypothetical protein